MIVETTPGLYMEALDRNKHKMARVRLAVQLRAYFEVLGGDKLSAEDIENLTQQSMDVISEVYQGYPTNQKGTDDE